MNTIVVCLGMRNKNACELFLFSGLSIFSSVPSGNLANTSSVGAKTVKGPPSDKVSAQPTAVVAAARVEN